MIDNYIHFFILTILTTTSMLIPKTNSKNPEAITNNDFLYVMLETLKFKGANVKEEGRKLVYFVDENKLDTDEKEMLKNIQSLRDRSMKLGKSIDLTRHGISVTDDLEEALKNRTSATNEINKELDIGLTITDKNKDTLMQGININFKNENKFFEDIKRISRMQTSIDNFIKKINKKSNFKILYSFDARKSQLFSDLLSHRLKSYNDLKAINKKDKEMHIEMLKLQCKWAYELTMRTEYKQKMKDLSSLHGKDDSDIFLHYTPTTDETDQTSSIKSAKKGGKKRRKDEIPLVTKS